MSSGIPARIPGPADRRRAAAVPAGPPPDPAAGLATDLATDLSTDLAADLPTARRPGRLAILTGVSSDSHTWNLVYLHLLLEELGWQVLNLGATTPDEDVVQACLGHRPDLLVVSSVNGHGHIDGTRMMTALRERAELAGLPAVIGGKLGIAGEVGADRIVALLTAGFDAVFQDGAGVDTFTRYVDLLGDGRIAVTP